MDISADLTISLTLKVGVVYKMEASELIETKDPHYFVVVAINDSNNYLLMSTTQMENRVTYLQKRGYDLDTLRLITPNNENGLKKDSFFDCNEYYTISKNNLIDKLKNKKLELSGNFSEEEYNLLVESINKSEKNDIPKFLLKYENK